MKPERETLVWSNIDVEDLETKLNVIRTQESLTHRGWHARLLPKVEEVLVDPEGKYTIIWSKVPEQFARDLIDRTIGARNEIARAQMKRQEMEDRGREAIDERNRQALEDYNSRSWWYRLWNGEPEPQLYYIPIHMQYNAALDELDQIARYGIVKERWMPEIPGPRRPLSDPTRF